MPVYPLGIGTPAALRNNGDHKIAFDAPHQRTGCSSGILLLLLARDAPAIAHRVFHRNTLLRCHRHHLCVDCAGKFSPTVPQAPPVYPLGIAARLQAHRCNKGDYKIAFDAPAIYAQGVPMEYCFFFLLAMLRQLRTECSSGTLFFRAIGTTCA
jgi:hypothetical protein